MSVASMWDEKLRHQSNPAPGIRLGMLDHLEVTISHADLRVLVDDALELERVRELVIAGTPLREAFMAVKRVTPHADDPVALRRRVTELERLVAALERDRDLVEKQRDEAREMLLLHVVAAETRSASGSFVDRRGEPITVRQCGRCGLTDSWTEDEPFSNLLACLGCGEKVRR